MFVETLPLLSVPGSAVFVGTSLIRLELAERTAAARWILEEPAVGQQEPARLLRLGSARPTPERQRA